MRILWNLRAPVAHPLVDLARRYLSASVTPGCDDIDVIAWEGPLSGHGYVRLPGGREGSNDGFDNLICSLAPDLVVEVTPQPNCDARIIVRTVDAPAHAGLTSVGSPLLLRYAGPAPGSATEPVPLVLFPRHADVSASQTRNLRAVGVLFDAGIPSAQAEAVTVAQRLIERLPGWEVRLLADPARAAERWSLSLSAGTGETRQELFTRWQQVELGECGTVIFLGKGPDWVPVVLDALSEGRWVIAAEDAHYAACIRDRGELLAIEGPDSAIAIAEALLQAEQDPASQAARLRRGAAWARRWTPERGGVELRAAIRTVAEATGIRGGASRWRLRREIGIGDIVFALSVAEALDQANPNREVTFHTHPSHVDWVSWFRGPSRVTSGPLEGSLGVHEVDYERALPHASERDRTLALGELAGVEPRRWVSRPTLPDGVREEAARLLGSGVHPRIAFAPSCAGQNDARSLPRQLALTVARYLTELGEVVWLEQEPLRDGLRLPPRVRNLAGQLPVSTVLGVLDRCNVVVSVDSGLLYLAVSLGRPVLGLFTYVAALQRLALAPRFVAVQPCLPCAPCGEGPHGAHCRRSGWAAGHPPCVLTITRELVVAGAGRALECAGREVWNVGPDGRWTVWEPDRLPAATCNLPPLQPSTRS